MRPDVYDQAAVACVYAAIFVLGYLLGTACEWYLTTRREAQRAQEWPEIRLEETQAVDQMDPAYDPYIMPVQWESATPRHLHGDMGVQLGNMVILRGWPCDDDGNEGA